MSENSTPKKSVLEVTESDKDRVANLATSVGTPIKEVTKALLRWALPNFEEGGDYELNKPEVTPSKKEDQAG